MKLKIKNNATFAEAKRIKAIAEAKLAILALKKAKA